MISDSTLARKFATSSSILTTKVREVASGTTLAKTTLLLKLLLATAVCYVLHTAWDVGTQQSKGGKQRVVRALTQDQLTRCQRTRIVYFEI